MQGWNVDPRKPTKDINVDAVKFTQSESNLPAACPIVDVGKGHFTNSLAFDEQPRA